MRLDQARRRMISVAAFDPSAYEDLRDEPAAMDDADVIAEALDDLENV